MGGQRGRLIPHEERLRVIDLINQAHRSGARKDRACKMLGLSLRTLERWEKNVEKKDKRSMRKCVPKNKLSDEEQDMILKISNSGKYCDLPPCKIVPLLADEGNYIASESSFYRVLRAKNQLVHRSKCKPKTHKKPISFYATKSNQVWTWDITYLPTQVTGLYFYLYLIIDIYSRKIVGWSIHEKESSDYASCLIKQACLDEKIKRNQIVLHSDNGSPMKGVTMIAMLEQLGVFPSFSRPSVSNDNPYSEAMFKTLKYHSTFPEIKKFATIIDARQWCENFSNWYNNEHLHSGLKFITPHQRHIGTDKLIMENRHKIYLKAQKNNPCRWSKKTRNWELPFMVSLNPGNKKIHNDKNKSGNRNPVLNACFNDLTCGAEGSVGAVLSS